METFEIIVKAIDPINGIHFYWLISIVVDGIW